MVCFKVSVILSDNVISWSQQKKTTFNIWRSPILGRKNPNYMKHIASLSINTCISSDSPSLLLKFINPAPSTNRNNESDSYPTSNPRSGQNCLKGVAHTMLSLVWFSAIFHYLSTSFSKKGRAPLTSFETSALPNTLECICCLRGRRLLSATNSGRMRIPLTCL